MATKVVSATVDEKIAEKLETIARDTRRKKSYFVNQALKEYFESLEDYDMALARKGGEGVPIDEAKEALGL
jgi:predicted transcriptional regulator